VEPENIIALHETKESCEQNNTFDGDFVGVSVGSKEGCSVGNRDGIGLGEVVRPLAIDGDSVADIGVAVGNEVGVFVGNAVGTSVGDSVRRADGTTVGTDEGLEVGKCEGLEVKIGRT
jgi:outer membrane lipoprotein SlyB